MYSGSPAMLGQGRCCEIGFQVVKEAPLTLVCLNPHEQWHLPSLSWYIRSKVSFISPGARAVRYLSCKNMLLTSHLGSIACPEWRLPGTAQDSQASCRLPLSCGKAAAVRSTLAYFSSEKSQQLH